MKIIQKHLVFFDVIPKLNVKKKLSNKRFRQTKAERFSDRYVIHWFCDNVSSYDVFRSQRETNVQTNGLS